MRVTVAMLALVAGASLTAGCNRQPAVQDPFANASSSPTPGPSLASRQPAPARTPVRSTTPTPFNELSAVSCNNRPSGEQVIAVVRRQRSLLPSGATINVTTGPLCAGTWQYTVLQVPDREPLQVVTKGAPESLSFVTAGTNVCTVEVRAYAPPGIQSTAKC
jgi:hypothetical protein